MRLAPFPYADPFPWGVGAPPAGQHPAPTCPTLQPGALPPGDALLLQRGPDLTCQRGPSTQSSREPGLGTGARCLKPGSRAAQRKVGKPRAACPERDGRPQPRGPGRVDFFTQRTAASARPGSDCSPRTNRSEVRLQPVAREARGFQPGAHSSVSLRAAPRGTPSPFPTSLQRGLWRGLPLAGSHPDQVPRVNASAVDGAAPPTLADDASARRPRG